MKSGCRSCALAAASSSALGIGRRKITLISTSIWAIPARSSAPIALRYSVSIRAWPHTKPIRQIVLTLTWSEKVGAVLARFSTPPQLRSHQWRSTPHNAPRPYGRGTPYHEPTVHVEGDLSEALRAVAVASAYGFPVSRLQRVWAINQSKGRGEK